VRRQHWTREDRCLGERAAALADGELGPDARDAALAHLVNCDGCRDEVAGQRRLKARLGELIEPLPPAGLFERLSAMGSMGAPELDLGPDEWQGPTPTRHRVHLPSRRRPGRFARVDHARPHGRRVVRYAMAGGVSVLALGVSAFALGGGPSTPTVVPSVDSFTFEHAQTTGEIPFGVVPASVPLRPALVGAKR
jgi:anti-sigma factor RsiW